MSLSIQERLKDLRVERGLTLGQLAEQTGLLIALVWIKTYSPSLLAQRKRSRYAMYYAHSITA